MKPQMQNGNYVIEWNGKRVIAPTAESCLLLYRGVQKEDEQQAENAEMDACLKVGEGLGIPAGTYVRVEDFSKFPKDAGSDQRTDGGVRGALKDGGAWPYWDTET